jgi:hypothetical protein
LRFSGRDVKRTPGATDAGPYQKLYPAVSMMQAGERWDCDYPAELLEWSKVRCVFA